MFWYQKMFGLLKIVILIQFLNHIKGCTVSIDVDIVKLEGSQTFVSCGVPCVATKVVWEKYNPNTKEWIQVFLEEASVYTAINTTVGYTLFGRSTGEKFGSEYFLLINKGVLSIPSDSGKWKCVVESGGTVYESGEVDLQIISQISGSDLNMTRNDTTALEQPEKYKCTSLKPLFPEFDVIWQVEGQNYTNGTNSISPSGFIWYTENEVVLTVYKETEDMDSEVICYFVKTVGTIHVGAKHISTRTLVKLPAAGLATWLIVLIVLIVLSIVAAVGGGIGYVYYKKSCTGT